jgi:hypothetical protein
VDKILEEAIAGWVASVAALRAAERSPDPLPFEPGYIEPPRPNLKAVPAQRDVTKKAQRCLPAPGPALRRYPRLRLVVSKTDRE